MNNKTINDFTNFDFSTLSSFLSKISPMEFGTIGCIVGLLIAAPLNSNEQNSLGNFFELVGQVILTIQAQQSYSTPQGATTVELEKLKKETEEKFKILYKEIKNMNKK